MSTSVKQLSRDPLGICTRPSVALPTSTANDSNPLYLILVRKYLNISSFLRPDELALTARVSLNWKGIMDSAIVWELQCKIQGFPENLPKGISCKQVLKDFYPKMLGADFYTDHIGRIEGAVPTIPEHFIVRAYQPDPVPDPDKKEGQLIKDTFQLGLKPEFITVAHLGTVGGTINNIGKIASNYIKKGIKTGFSNNAWVNCFQQHGDKRSPSSWSFQRKAVIGTELSYSEEEELAAKANMEIVSLPDRIFLDILSQIRFGISPDARHMARTSTVTIEEGSMDGTSEPTPRQTVVYWDTLHGTSASYRLHLASYGQKAYFVGAAVGIPAKP